MGNGSSSTGTSSSSVSSDDSCSFPAELSATSCCGGCGGFRGAGAAAGFMKGSQRKAHSASGSRFGCHRTCACKLSHCILFCRRLCMSRGSMSAEYFL
ncbi:hypothetical protein RvY_10825 [Ramazzottius varieornatus]|uniref:Uncharacterized protein n=1 Tax=Ramazzottius varieornatus TaxID=947166 RepID=A0A1D1VN10_RAMVA|nr:hypothetical protein RvY_10825 [Ramazzottius varieornatus]